MSPKVAFFRSAGYAFVIQIYVASTDAIGSFGAIVSPYFGGTLRMRARTGPPFRRALKLLEAFHELDRYPKDGEAAVDLGAAPGGLPSPYRSQCLHHSPRPERRIRL